MARLTPLLAWYNADGGGLSTGGFAMRVRRTAAVVLAAALALTVAGRPAEAGTPLAGVEGYQAVRVPGTHTIAIAGGRAGLVIARTDLTVQGKVADTGFIRSVFATSSRTVWAAAPYRRQIIAIDPLTRTVKRRFRLPSTVCPGSVAVTGRFVVFGYTCFRWAGGAWGATGVGVLDTSTGALRLRDGMSTPMVTASPALPGRAFVMDQGSYGTSLQLLDVTGGTARALKSRYYQIAKAWDLAVSPDGSKIAIADMHDSKLRVLRTADLSVIADLDSPVSPRAAAWLTDTRVAVAGINGHSTAAGGVFDLGKATPRSVFRWAAVPEGPVEDLRFVCQRCLTIAADRRRAVVVSDAVLSVDPRLDAFGLETSSLTITAPAQATVDAPYRLDLQLRLENGAAPPAGTKVTVYRARDFTAPQAVGTAVVDSTGAATLTDVPYYAGWTTWTAGWPGDRYRVAALAPGVRREVAKAPASMSMAFERGKTTGKTVTGTLVVTVSPLLDERTVRIETRTANGDGHLGSYTLDSTGTVRVPLTVSTPTTYLGTFYGGLRQQHAYGSVHVEP